MENALQVFSYNNQQLRTTEINGETWLVAKDVCDILELSNSRMVTDDLDDDEKGVSNIYTPGGMQNMTVINESGLYKLTFETAHRGDKRIWHMDTDEIAAFSAQMPAVHVQRQSAWLVQISF